MHGRWEASNAHSCAWVQLEWGSVQIIASLLALYKGDIQICVATERRVPHLQSWLVPLGSSCLPSWRSPTREKSRSPDLGEADRGASRPAVIFLHLQMSLLFFPLSAIDRPRKESHKTHILLSSAPMSSTHLMPLRSKIGSKDMGAPGGKDLHFR